MRSFIGRIAVEVAYRKSENENTAFGVCRDVNHPTGAGKILNPDALG